MSEQTLDGGKIAPEKNFSSTAEERNVVRPAVHRILDNRRKRGLKLDRPYIAGAFDSAVEIKKTADEEIAELREENQEIIKGARTDKLTGALKKEAFDIRLQESLDLHRQLGASFTLLMVDIDKFKLVNDTHGHLSGDQTLAALGKIFKDTLRETDILGRPGGDEFAVILTGTPQLSAPRFSERLRATVKDELLPAVKDTLSGREQPLTISIGGATYKPGEPMDTEELKKRADIALYNSKHGKKGGGNRDQVTFYQEGMTMPDKAEPHTVIDQAQ